MGEGLAPKLRESVIPLCAEGETAPVQLGSGTLFRVADTSFLVTAAHVADVAAQQGHQLYVSDGLPGSKGCGLHGPLHLARQKSFDLALWELPPDVVAALPTRRFLRLVDVDLSETIKGGWFYIHGFPGCWSAPDPNVAKIIVTTFTYGAVLYGGPMDAFADHDPDVHVLLSVPKSGNADRDGNRAVLPNDLGGISGSSLWQAYAEGQKSAEWTPDFVKVIAVQTGVYDLEDRDEYVVRGTRWGAVATVIWRNYESLRPALALNCSGLSVER